MYNKINFFSGKIKGEMDYIFAFALVTRTTRQVNTVSCRVYNEFFQTCPDNHSWSYFTNSKRKITFANILLQKKLKYTFFSKLRKYVRQHSFPLLLYRRFLFYDQSGMGYLYILPHTQKAGG